MIDPSKIAFSREVDYIDIQDFNGLIDLMVVLGGNAGAANAGVALLTDANGFVLTKTAATDRASSLAVYRGSSAVADAPTAPIMLSVGGLMGLNIQTATHGVRHFMRIPNRWNRKEPIYFRVHWTSASGDIADTINWKLLYKTFQANVTALAVPATALSTAIPQDSVVVGSPPQLTDNGVLNPGVIPDAHTHISLAVSMDAFAAGLTEGKYLLGLEIEYTPRYGARKSKARRAMTV